MHAPGTTRLEQHVVAAVDATLAYQDEGYRKTVIQSLIAELNGFPTDHWGAKDVELLAKEFKDMDDSPYDNTGATQETLNMVLQLIKGFLATLLMILLLLTT
jgi:hypothetical protein